MANWKEWINTEETSRRVALKPNKNQFCRKNRSGNQYGLHQYDETGRCKFCQRIKDKSNNNMKEMEIMTNE